MARRLHHATDGKSLEAANELSLSLINQGHIITELFIQSYKKPVQEYYLYDGVPTCRQIWEVVQNEMGGKVEIYGSIRRKDRNPLYFTPHTFVANIMREDMIMGRLKADEPMWRCD